MFLSFKIDSVVRNMVILWESNFWHCKKYCSASSGTLKCRQSFFEILFYLLDLDYSICYVLFFHGEELFRLVLILRIWMNYLGLQLVVFLLNDCLFWSKSISVASASWQILILLFWQLECNFKVIVCRCQGCTIFSSMACKNITFNSIMPPRLLYRFQ